jgi:DNA-binding response OmpR family regulator
MTAIDRATVLLVNSDSVYTEAIGIVLNANGFEVIYASAAEAGLRKIETENPDVVVLDLMQGNSDEGFSVVRSIRNELKSRVPVIMLSSLTEKTGYSFKYKEHPDYFSVEGYLERPVSPDILVRSIRDILGKGDM